MKISNIKDLNREILLYETLNKQQEILLREDFEVLKKDLSPGHLIKSGFSSFVENRGSENYLLNLGFNQVLWLLTDKVFLRSQPKFVRAVLYFVIKQFAGRYISKNSENITSNLKMKLGEIFSRFKKKEEPETFPEEFSDHPPFI